jgi:hypothetical protein
MSKKPAHGAVIPPATGTRRKNGSAPRLDQPSFGSYLGALKSATGLMAGIGAIVPAVLAFQQLAPPFLSSVPWLVPALATATVFGIYHFRFRRGRVHARMPALVKRGLQILASAVILLLLYLTLLHFTTSMDPAGEERYQIGFGKARWGLTDYAKERKKMSDPVAIWMLQGAYYRPNGPEKLWKPVAIYSAGGVLTIVFMGTFILWSMGWALLAKHHATVEREPDGGGEDIRAETGTSVERSTEPEDADAGGAVG